jgi:hypothetical protein
VDLPCGAARVEAGQPKAPRRSVWRLACACSPPPPVCACGGRRPLPDAGLPPPPSPRWRSCGGGGDSSLRPPFSPPPGGRRRTLPPHLSLLPDASLGSARFHGGARESGGGGSMAEAAGQIRCPVAPLSSCVGTGGLMSTPSPLVVWDLGPPRRGGSPCIAERRSRASNDDDR